MKKTKKPAKKKAAKPIKKRRIINFPASKSTTRFIKRSAEPVSDKSSKPAAALTASQRQELRTILLQKRDELREVVQRKKEQEVEDPTITAMGDEADVATRSVEKEMLFELTDTEKQMLDMVEAALRRMEKGVYGFCEACQKVIPPLRLQVMPWARYCISCQSSQELSPSI